jgi:hypothetical protein
VFGYGKEHPKGGHGAGEVLDRHGHRFKEEKWNGDPSIPK